MVGIMAIAKKPPGLLSRLTRALFVPSAVKAKKPGVKNAGAGRPAKSGDPRLELARLIKSMRARLDPKILKLAEKVARRGPPVTDQERAVLSVELFLAQRNDGGQFAEKLRERLAQERSRLH